jgi:hypothetical protein
MIPLGGMEGRKEFRALQLVKRIRHPNLVPTIAFWVRDAEGTTLDDAVVSQLDLRAPALDENGFRATASVPPAAASQAVELIIVMGLGDVSLYDRLQECRADGDSGIPAEELLHYMDGAAAAIDYLNRPVHDLGTGPVAIQHCDIKPHNIMIVGGAAQLCDFGLARAIGSVRMTTALAATLAYAAPECLQTGKPSEASDQYSLAMTYYELRTGQLPYQDSTYGAVMSAVLQGELDFSAVSQAEQAVCHRMKGPAGPRRQGDHVPLSGLLVGRLGHEIEAHDIQLDALVAQGIQHVFDILAELARAGWAATGLIVKAVGNGHDVQSILLRLVANCLNRLDDRQIQRGLAHRGQRVQPRLEIPANPIGERAQRQERLDVRVGVQGKVGRRRQKTSGARRIGDHQLVVPSRGRVPPTAVTVCQHADAERFVRADQPQ